MSDAKNDNQENNLTKKTTQPRKQLNQENNSTKKIS
jgi:hypothetical protein